MHVNFYLLKRLKNMCENDETEKFDPNKCLEEYAKRRPTSDYEPPEVNEKFAGLNLDISKQSIDERPPLPDWIQDEVQNERFCQFSEPNKDTNQENQKKWQPFKHLGFTTHEQDLANLQETNHTNIPLAGAHYDEYAKKIHSDFNHLLALLSEDHYRMNWKFNQPHRPQSLNFEKQRPTQYLYKKQEYAILSLQKLKIDFETASEEKLPMLRKYLDTFLTTSDTFKPLFEEEKKIYTTQHHLLNQLGQYFMTKTTSVNTAICFAALTGNVCFLLLAIDFIQRDDFNEEELTGIDFWPTIKPPFFQLPLIFVRYQNLPLIFVRYQNSVPHLKLLPNQLSLDARSGYLYTFDKTSKNETKLNRYTFNQKEQTWTQTSWEWQIWQKIKEPFSICQVQLANEKSEIFVVDSNGKTINKNESSQFTNLCLNIDENKGLVRMNYDNCRLYISALVEKGFKTTCIYCEGRYKRKIIIQHKYDKQVVDFQFLGVQGLALVLFNKKDGSTDTEQINLLYGKYSSQCSDQSKFSDQDLIIQERQLINSDFQQTKAKLKVPTCKGKLFEVQSFYLWPIKGSGQFELFEMKDDQTCYWNMHEKGIWSFQENNKGFTVQRGKKTYVMSFDTSNIDLKISDLGKCLFVQDYTKLPLEVQKQTDLDDVQAARNHKHKGKQESVRFQQKFIPTETEIFADADLKVPLFKELLKDGRVQFNEECLIVVDFKRQIVFSALSIETEQTTDIIIDAKSMPCLIQVFAAIDGKWQSVNEWKFDWHPEYSSSNQGSQQCFVQCGLVRTHALLLNIRNENGKRLFAKKLRFYDIYPEGQQDLSSQMIGSKEFSQEFLSIEGKFNNLSQLIGKGTVSLVKDDQSIYVVQTPQKVNDDESLEEQKHETFSKTFFDMSQSKVLELKPKSSKSKQEISQILAFLINSFSDCEEKKFEFPNSWLYKYPNAQFFELMVRIFQRKDKKINKLLSSCFSHNLHLCLIFNIDISKLQGQLFTKEEFNAAQEALCEANPDSFYNLLRLDDAFKLSIRSEWEKVIHNQRPLFKDGELNMLNHHFRFQFRTILIQLMSQEFNLFAQTFTNLLENQRYAELEAFLLSLTKIKEALPFQVQSILLKTMHQKNLQIPSHLNRLIGFIFRHKIIKQYLRFKETEKRENFDYKGYLVTQSEILSGGIQGDQIGFFKDSTIKEIASCCDMIQDQTFAYQAETQINTQSKSDNQFMQIIHQGSNEFIDEFIGVLHRQLLNSNIQVKLQSNKSKNGLGLTRAAFAVMIKLNPEMQTAMEDMIDQIDLRSGEDLPPESGAERDQALKEVCQQQPQYEQLRKLWVQAAKMYSWLHQKSSSTDKKYDDISELNEREQKIKEHIDIIYSQIIEKAEFLIKLNPPKQFSATEQKNIGFQRMPSYVNSSLPIQFIRQSTTNQKQQAGKLNVEKQNAATQSVLSCLQSPVICQEIQTQVEHNYLSAVRRYTGLVMLNESINENSTSYEFIDATNCLREIQVDDDGVKHYLDQIQGGCNQHLDTCIRKVMFEILTKFAKRLQVTKIQEESLSLIYALHWQYHARDFKELLDQINIFPLLAGKDLSDSLMTQSWGKVYTKFKNLKENLITTFSEVFITILGRITDVSIDKSMQLKVHGNLELVSQVPSLRRVKSMLDEDTSSLLIDSAMRVVFRAFDNTCKESKKLKNCDKSAVTLFEHAETTEQKLHLLQQVIDGVQTLQLASSEDLQEDSQVVFKLKFSKSEIQIKDMDDKIPSGWRMMSSLQYLKNKEIVHAMLPRWHICRLTDGHITGSGHGFSHEKPGRNDLGHKLIVKMPSIQPTLTKATKVEKEYKVDKFFSEKKKVITLGGNRREMYSKIPKEWFQDIVLADEIKLPVHPCVLRKRDKNSNGLEWTCSNIVDKDLGVNFCYNNLDEFKSHQCEGWRCDRCDFDFCLECAQSITVVDDYLTQTFDWIEWLNLPQHIQYTTMPEGILKNVPLFNSIQPCGSEKTYLYFDKTQAHNDKVRKEIKCTSNKKGKSCRIQGHHDRMERQIYYRSLIASNDGKYDCICFECAKVEYVKKNFLIKSLEQSFDLKVYLSLDSQLQEHFKPFNQLVLDYDLKKEKGVKLQQHNHGLFRYSQDKVCGQFQCKGNIQGSMKCDKCELSLCISCFLKCLNFQSKIEPIEDVLKEKLRFHNPMNEIVSQIPQRLIKDQVKDKKKLYIPSHYHELNLSNSKSKINFRECNGNKLWGRCANYHSDGQNAQCYECRTCNFYICKHCINLDLYVQQYREQHWDWFDWLQTSNGSPAKRIPDQIFKQVFNIDFHETGFELKLKEIIGIDKFCTDSHQCAVYKKDYSSTYRCNSRLTGGCVNQYSPKLKCPYTPAFKCKPCDYDCCFDCAKVIIAMSNLAKQLISSQTFDWKKYFQLPYEHRSKLNQTDVLSVLADSVETDNFGIMERIINYDAQSCVNGEENCKAIKLEKCNFYFKQKDTNTVVCAYCILLDLKVGKQNDQVCTNDIIVEVEEEIGLTTETTKICQFYNEQIQLCHLDKLLPCVKLLSSTALASPRVAEVVKKVANAYYIRTLAELLLITTIENKLLILSIIEDLVKLGLSLELDEKPLLKCTLMFNGWLQDFLYQLARELSFGDKAYEQVKIITRTLKKILQKSYLQSHLAKLQSYDERDQILLLILSDSGAELDRPVIGDLMQVIKNELPTPNPLKIMKFVGSKVEVFNIACNKTEKHQLHELKSFKETTNSIFPPNDQVKVLLTSTKTNPLIKVMLMNMLLANQTHFKELINELSLFMQTQIIQREAGFRYWQKKQDEHFCGSFYGYVPIEHEQKCAVSLFESKPKTQPKVKEVKVEKQRNLIKTLYRNTLKASQKEKESKPRNLINCLYKNNKLHQIEKSAEKVETSYLIDQILFFYNVHVGQALYHLTPDPQLKEYIKLKASSNVKHFSQNDLKQALKNYSLESIQSIFTKCENTITFKPIKNRKDFKELFKHEITHLQPENYSPEKISVFRQNPDLLLQNKFAQLLFQTIDPQRVDTLFMWFMVKHYSESKAYNDMKCSHQTGINTRFFNIILNSQEEFKKLYFWRILTSAQKETESYYRQIFIVAQQIIDSFEVYGEEYGFQLALTLIVRIQRNQTYSRERETYETQEKIRKSIDYITQLISIAPEELFNKICCYPLFYSFLKQAPKAKKAKRGQIYQFQYAVIQLRQKINERCKQFEQSKHKKTIEVLTKAKKNEKKVSISMDFFEKMLDQDSCLEELKKQKTDIKIRQKNFEPEKWEQLDVLGDWLPLPKIEKTKDESGYRNFIIRVSEGKGISSLFVSDQPKIYEKTKQYFLTKDNKQQLWLDLSEQNYIKVGCQSTNLLERTVKSGKIKQKTFLCSYKPEDLLHHTIQIIDNGFTKIPFFDVVLSKDRKQAFLVLKMDESHKKAMTFKLTGFGDSPIKEIQFNHRLKNRTNCLAVFQDFENNFYYIPFLQTFEDLETYIFDQKNYFLDKNKKKIKYFLDSDTLIEDSQTRILSGQTQRGNQLTIFVEKPIENEASVSIRFCEIDQPEITYEGKLESNEKEFKVKGSEIKCEEENFNLWMKTYSVQPFQKEHQEKYPNRRIEHFQISQNTITFVDNQSKIYQGVYGQLVDFIDPKVQLVSEIQSKIEGSPIFVHHFDQVDKKDSDSENSVNSSKEQEIVDKKWVVGFQKLKKIEYHVFNSDGKYSHQLEQFKDIQESNSPNRLICLTHQGKVGYLKADLKFKLLKDLKDRQDLTFASMHKYLVLDDNAENGLCCYYFKASNHPDIYFFTSEKQRGLDEDFLAEFKQGLHNNKLFDDWLSTNFKKEIHIDSYKEFKKVEFGLHDPKNGQDNSQWKYDEFEIQRCIEFLNLPLKNMKFKELWHLLKKKKLLTKILKLTSSENHNIELINMIIGINQYVFNKKGWLLAMANDKDFTKMQVWRKFADKFMLPQMLMMIYYYSQMGYQKHDDQHIFYTVKFDRISSDESLFDQLTRQVTKSTQCFGTSEGSQAPFKTEFKGEMSYDAGGPFRDVLELICSEIIVRFLKQTSNMEALPDIIGFQPQLLQSLQDEKNLLFIGKMIGWVIQSYSFNLSLDMNIIFWKHLLKEEITLEDLRSLDQYRYDFIQLVKNLEYPSTFVADLGTGDELDLKENGSQIQVTAENAEEYEKLYLKKYLDVDRKQYDIICRGAKTICSVQMLNLLTPKIASSVAFSSPSISPEVFLSLVRPANSSKPAMQYFYAMVREFTNQERQMLLKFITGSSRLMLSESIRVELQNSWGDNKFPIGHTCGYSVDLPNYTSLNVMKEKFRVAMTMCGEIDDDGQYMDDEYGSDSYGSGGESSESESNSSASESNTSSLEQRRNGDNQDISESYGSYASYNSYSHSSSYESSSCIGGNHSERSEGSCVVLLDLDEKAEERKSAKSGSKSDSWQTEEEGSDNGDSSGHSGESDSHESHSEKRSRKAKSEGDKPQSESADQTESSLFYVSSFYRDQSQYYSEDDSSYDSEREHSSSNSSSSSNSYGGEDDENSDSSGSENSSDESSCSMESCY